MHWSQCGSSWTCTGSSLWESSGELLHICPVDPTTLPCKYRLINCTDEGHECIACVLAVLQVCSAADCLGLHPGSHLHLQSVVAGAPLCLLHASRGLPRSGPETSIHLQSVNFPPDIHLHYPCLVREPVLEFFRCQQERAARCAISLAADVLPAQGMLLNAVTCVGSSAGVFLCYTLLFVVRTQPWWAPQYFIPILGMMLGNSISGVSVGLSALLEDFSVGEPVSPHCTVLNFQSVKLRRFVIDLTSLFAWRRALDHLSAWQGTSFIVVYMQRRCPRLLG